MRKMRSLLYWVLTIMFCLKRLSYETHDLTDNNENKESKKGSKERYLSYLPWTNRTRKLQNITKQHFTESTKILRLSKSQQSFQLRNNSKRSPFRMHRKCLEAVLNSGFGANAVPIPVFSTTSIGTWRVPTCTPIEKFWHVYVER